MWEIKLAPFPSLLLIEVDRITLWGKHLVWKTDKSKSNLVPQFKFLWAGKGLSFSEPVFSFIRRKVRWKKYKAFAVCCNRVSRKHLSPVVFANSIFGEVSFLKTWWELKKVVGQNWWLDRVTAPTGTYDYTTGIEGGDELFLTNLLWLTCTLNQECLFSLKTQTTKM